jgi:hypothetical protein
MLSSLRKILSKNSLEEEIIKPVLTGGKEVKRYKIYPNGYFLIYSDNNTKHSKYPNICTYINSYKDKITCKEVKQKKHSIYALHRARDKEIFLKKNKIVGVITEDEIVCSRDYNNFFVTDGLYLFQLENPSLAPYILGCS